MLAGSRIPFDPPAEVPASTGGVRSGARGRLQAAATVLGLTALAAALAGLPAPGSTPSYATEAPVRSRG